MKSSYNILSTLYQVINPVLLPEISGKVIIGEEPDRDQKENITLGLIANPVDYLQSATGNVNIHVWGIDENTPNHARMMALIDILIPLLNDTVYTVGDTTLHVTIEDDKGVFKNQENQGKYFYNLRINCITL